MLEELWRDAPSDARAIVGSLSTKATLTIRDATERALTLVGSPDKFFTPSTLSGEGGRQKEAFLASRCLWVDWDATEPSVIPSVQEVIRNCTLPPNYVVATGGGYHLYWLLSHWVLDINSVEEANKLLAEDVGGDSCWDGTRVLRLPATLNTKYDPAADVSVVLSNPAHRYALTDVLALGRVGKKTRHKIRTGDRRGYPSRSERDLAIVGALLRADVSPETISHIFERHACGDRYREEAQRGFDYLALTMGKVVQDAEKKELFAEEAEGLFYTAGKTRRHVATFTFTPEKLLEIVDSDDQALMGVMLTEYGTTSDVVLPRTAFNSVRAMQRELRQVAWQWLGTDKVVREYLPYLVDKLWSEGMPSVAATTVLGYHATAEPCYVFDGWTLTREGLRSGYDRPVIYLSRGQEHPHYYGMRKLSDEARAKLLERTRVLLPRLNLPEVIYPMLGWFLATPFKPRLRNLGYKFPTLNVYGTRGSGKTTLIQNVMLQLLGVTTEGGGPAVSYDANTTRFVTLALLGGSNCVPLSFSEFREASVSVFLRYILLAYDSGRDPRGRSDQTTVNYPLIAPFVVDGEDRISDPAGVERTVAVGLTPNTISEASNCARAYTELAKLPLCELAEDIYSWCLTADVEELLREAEQIVSETLPETLPDRIRRNAVVCAVGMLAAGRIGVVDSVDWQALRVPVLESVAERGRTLVSADVFIEELTNAVAIHSSSFSYKLEGEVLWFQFATAYNWWVSRLRRRGVGGTLSASSIRRQLTELASERDSYVSTPALVRERYMWGINIKQAQAAGLDVPAELVRGPKLKGGDV